MLECVINISESRRRDVVDVIARAAGDHLLDVHIDDDHNRAVLTIAGPDVEARSFAVATRAIERIDLRQHAGVHPRLGAADVVPFVPLAASSIADALAARDRTAARIAQELGVPCFLYGPERSLPDVRRRAFVTLSPDVGSSTPHPTAGACCVGARPVLVAYNLWLHDSATLDDARRIAGAIRQPGLRTLGLAVGDAVQVSCNLIDPEQVGPAVAYDLVQAHTDVARAELVGLVPASVLATIPANRWVELDVSPTKTIEARLAEAGLDGGS